MKKIFILCLFTCTVMIAMCMSGCGGSSERRVHITIAGWNIVADTFREAVPLFEATHPNISVEVQDIESKYTELMPRFAADVAVPDIMLIQLRDFQAIAAKHPNAFLDITKEAAEVKDNFVDAGWDGPTINGKIYGIPYDVGPAAMFYREDIFRQCGISPDSIETWDDFIEAGKVMKAKTNGATCIMGISEDLEVFDQLLNEAGASYVADDNETVTLNSPEGKKAAATLSRMVKADILRDTVDWNGRLAAMKQDKIATVPYGVWFAGTMKSVIPEQSGKWRVMPLPAYEKGGLRASNAGGSVLAISAGTKHRAEAMEFLRFFLNTIEGQSLELNNGMFPAFKPIYETPQFRTSDPYFGGPIYPFFGDVAKNMLPMRRGPITMDTDKQTMDMIRAILKGEDPDKVMDQAAKDIAAVMNMKVKE